MISDSQVFQTIRTVSWVVALTALVVAEYVLQKTTGEVWLGYGGLIDWRSEGNLK